MSCAGGLAGAVQWDGTVGADQSWSTALESIGLASIGQEVTGLAPIGQEAIGLAPIGPEATGLAPVGPEVTGLAPVGPEATGPPPIGPAATGEEATGEEVTGRGEIAPARRASHSRSSGASGWTVGLCRRLSSACLPGCFKF
jgi:hypothetical protein